MRSPTFYRALASLSACVPLLLFALPALAWNPAPTQPLAALFSPDEVRLTVEETLTPETLPSGGTGFLLSIPSGVRADTFLVTMGGKASASHYWLPGEERDAVLAARLSLPVPGKGTLPEHEPSPERRALLSALVVLEEEANRAEGDLAAVQMRLALWQKSLDRFTGEAARPAFKDVAPLSTAEETAKLDESYTLAYPALYLQRGRHSRTLEDARLRLRLAHKKLSDFDRKAGCEIVIVPCEDKKPQAIRYTYSLPASCTLNYRLTAWPDRGEITIAQDAVLNQHSGFAWENVETYLSTVRRDRSLEPAHITPWHISLGPRFIPAQPLPKNQPSKSGVMMDADESVFDVRQNAQRFQRAAGGAPADSEREDAAPESAPVQEERSTYRLWSLGKQRIEHTVPTRLALASDIHKASFLYTLRPVSNPKGFLTATLDLPQALELPPGQAQFSVDDAMIGSRMFTFNGAKGSIFFGTDPQVTAIMRDMKQSSGEEGLFNKDEVRNWHWQITLASTRAKPVQAYLEDPAPVGVNEAVKITVDSSPKPEKLVNPPEDGGATIFRWAATLNPGEAVVINHKVRATAPVNKDLELRPGR